MLIKAITKFAENGIVPDGLIRIGIRRLLAKRRSELSVGEDYLQRFIQMMNMSPVALVPKRANEQHYELPPEFFGHVLGIHRKYSCCYWENDEYDLDAAEAAALSVTCERAGIKNGMRILELGCGWGALTLWLAKNYPDCQITAVSNSAPQRRYIEDEVVASGLSNVTVLTADMNDFAIEEKFHRIVSLEMFEHMRNYRVLFERISKWLTDDGKFFMHIFCHRETPYEFEDRGDGDWMTRYFFAGGMMPSEDLPLHFQEHLALQNQWTWNGRHYAKTADAWLSRMDSSTLTLDPILSSTYGAEQAALWSSRWRMFFMAVAELFGHDEGREWYVGHYLFGPTLKQKP